jgi:hypothetical protein
MEDEPGEALRRLEERLGRVTEAAERLISDTAQNHERRPPPAGWQAPPEEHTTRPLPELDALISAFASLRELIPPEVSDRVVAAVKEVLLALRALLDYYLERLNRKPSPPAEVQDIPID